jgi:hypothetical protein
MKQRTMARSKPIHDWNGQYALLRAESAGGAVRLKKHEWQCRRRQDRSPAVEGVLSTAVLGKWGPAIVIEGHETLTPELFNHRGGSCKLTLSEPKEHSGSHRPASTLKVAEPQTTPTRLFVPLFSLLKKN